MLFGGGVLMKLNGGKHFLLVWNAGGERGSNQPGSHRAVLVFIVIFILVLVIASQVRNDSK